MALYLAHLSDQGYWEVIIASTQRIRNSLQQYLLT